MILTMMTLLFGGVLGLGLAVGLATLVVIAVIALGVIAAANGVRILGQVAAPPPD